MKKKNLKLEEIPDFFSPKILAELIGTGVANAYNLVRVPGFPARRVGRRIIISKNAFIRWWEQEWVSQ